MIKLNNGSRISNIVVSTILGHGGNGMFPLYFFPKYREILELIKTNEISVLTKSSTYDARIGNYIPHKPWTWKFIQKTKDGGLLNAYGLTNDGINRNSELLKKSKKHGFRVIPNIHFEFSNTTNKVRALSQIRAAIVVYRFMMGLVSIVEINVSCPNTDDDITMNSEATCFLTENLKRLFPDIAFIVKISYVHKTDFVKRLEQAGADVIHAINTIPFALVFPEKTSPLHHVGGGGVSGKPAFEMALKRNEEFRKATKLPMIMGCGVSSVEDAQKFFDIGADAVSICSVIKLSPNEAKKIITEWR